MGKLRSTIAKARFVVGHRKAGATLSQGYFPTLLRRIGAQIWRFGIEQVILVLLAVVALALQLRYGLVRQGDWKPSMLTILWPYAGLIGAFVVYQFLRVPRLLYLGQTRKLQDAQTEIEQLTREHLYLATFAVTDIQGERIDYKGEISGGGEWRYHIFVRPEILAVTPKRLIVEEYRLEINFHGHKQFPTAVFGMRSVA